MNEESKVIKAEGNLISMALDGKFDVIVHGCNCFNRMGSGIALEVKNVLPEAYDVDQATTAGDYNKLGNYTVAPISRKDGTVTFDVINAYTQYDIAKTHGEDVFEYASFLMICQKLANRYKNSRIGIPYIGMGLAGGDTEIIMDGIELFAEMLSDVGSTLTLVEFKKEI